MLFRICIFFLVGFFFILGDFFQNKYVNVFFITQNNNFIKKNLFIYLDKNKFYKYYFKKKYKNINFLLKNNIFLEKKNIDIKNSVNLNSKDHIFIKSLQFFGDKFLLDKDLKNYIKNFGIFSGKIFSKDKLKKFLFSLNNLYKLKYKMNPIIKFSIIPYKINKIQIKILILEEKSFSLSVSRFLRDNFFFKKKTFPFVSKENYKILWNFYNISDYKKKIFQESLNKLYYFYKKKGYLNFKILYIKKKILLNNKIICFKTYINKGYQYSIENIYHFNDFKNNSKIKREIKNYFSDKLYNLFEYKLCKKNIQRYFLKLGYINMNILCHSECDDKKKILCIHFLIIPNTKYFIKKCIILKYNKIQDSFLKYFLDLQKNQIFNKDLIFRNAIYLIRNGLYTNINIISCLDKKKNNAINIFYKVYSYDNGGINFSTGYDSKKGLLLRFFLLKKNFFGLGNSINLKILKNILFTHIDVWLSKPYCFIKDLYVKTHFYVNSFKRNMKNEKDYVRKKFGCNIVFFTPRTNRKKFLVASGYTSHSIAHISSQISLIKYLNFFKDKLFIDHKINNFTVYDFFIKYIFDFNSLNKIYYPDIGSHIKFFGKLILPFSDNYFHKMSFSANQYVPLNKSPNILLHMCSQIGLGLTLDKYKFPFYENYFSGGSKSIRGFKNNKIGPVSVFINKLKRNKFNFYQKKNFIYPNISSLHAIGGNGMFHSNLELIYSRIPLSNRIFQFFQLGIFLDSANVWDSKWKNMASIIENKDFSKSDIIYISAGIFARLVSFLGPVTLTFSLPILDHHMSKHNLDDFNIDFGEL